MLYMVYQNYQNYIIDNNKCSHVFILFDHVLDEITQFWSSICWVFCQWTFSSLIQMENKTKNHSCLKIFPDKIPRDHYNISHHDVETCCGLS